MNFKKKLALFLLLLSAICFTVVFKLVVVDRQSPALASFRVDSFPKATVFLNNHQAGQTPYLGENLTPGEYTLELIPAGTVTGTFTSWEAKVKLTGGTLTYVSRSLGPTQQSSGGQTLTLEKIPSDRAHELAVISNPDGVTVTVDGQNEGQTSLVLRNLDAGDHEIVFSLVGYSDEVVHGRLSNGFRLNVVADLAQIALNPASPSAVPIVNLLSSPSGEMAKPYVIIKNTETGYLRVHQEPDISSTEAARVKPGEKYPLLSVVTGWVKIKLPTLFGWVSDQYVDKVQ